MALIRLCRFKVKQARSGMLAAHNQNINNSEGCKMKKKISIRCDSSCIFSWRMILVSVIFSFVCPLILRAEIQNGSFKFDEFTRNYMVYLPTNYTGSSNFPLVICLHPYGRTAEWMMNYANMNQAADASDFIVVYPSAIPNWNSGVADNPDYPTPDVDDVGFINALIDIMSNSYSIDLERIYACGYSNGGFMSYKLACQLGNRIAAIASVGGMLSTSTAASCSPLRTMPVLHIHGTADPYALINGGTGFYSVDQTLSYWINFNDCVQIDTTTLPDLDPTDGCTVEKITYTTCSDNCSVVYYKVINGGHTWPGASPLAMGNTNQDFDASVEIWNFFKNHKLVIPPIVDLNGDGIVDADDMCIMVDHWGEDYSLCDIGPTSLGDRVVDVEDLKVLAEHLFEEVDDPTLVAHWALDEAQGSTAHENVSGRDGLVVGDAIWRPTDGKVGGALELDGISSCIIPGFGLNPADGPFSLLAWIKGGTPGQAIVSVPMSANWLMLDADGKLVTELTSTGQVNGTLASETILIDGAWHRIGLVWDGSRRMLYADGTVAAEDTPALWSAPGGGLYIGVGQDYAAGTFFSGLIDDVRIYSRVVHP